MVQTVTPDLLKSTDAVATKNMSDEVLDTLIAKAELIAVSDGFPETVTVNGKTLEILNEAITDMALHLCSVIGLANKGVTSEKVDVLERHYSDFSTKGWLDSSKWGSLYLWLYQTYGGGAIPRIAVIQH